MGTLSTGSLCLHALWLGDLGQCWQSDPSLPKSALTFPHLDLWGSGPAPLRISGDQEGRVNHALVSQPRKLKEAVAEGDHHAQGWILSRQVEGGSRKSVLNDRTGEVGRWQAVGVGYLVLKMCPAPPSVLEDLGSYMWMCSQEASSDRQVHQFSATLSPRNLTVFTKVPCSVWEVLIVILLRHPF